MPGLVSFLEGLDEVLGGDGRVGEGEVSETRVRGVEVVLKRKRRERRSAREQRRTDEEEGLTFNCIIAITSLSTRSRSKVTTDAFEACQAFANPFSSTSLAVVSLGSLIARRKILSASSILTPPKGNLATKPLSNGRLAELEKNSPSLALSSSGVLKRSEAMLSPSRFDLWVRRSMASSVF